MQKVSMWWLFLALFGLTIGGVQTLGWWTRPVAAHSGPATASSAALRHEKCESKHWRAVFMQQ